MSSDTIETHVRVLDAPPLDRRRTGSSSDQNGGGMASFFRRLFYVTLLAQAIFCFSAALHSTAGTLNLLIVYIRYLLWPMIILGLVLHLFRSGGSHYARTITVVLPFFLIGVLSGLVGVDPIQSARMVTFWALGVTGAIVIGAELPARTVRTVMIWSFFALLTASILLAFAMPSFAIMRDLRTGDAGAWRGLFPGKNALGQMSAYAIVMAFISQDIRWKHRLPTVLVGSICLIFASSQGSILLAMAGVAFPFSVGLLRAIGLSRSAQASILFFLVCFIFVLTCAAYAPVLELLGRDSSLTGRTDIWDAYFRRALEHWILGTGPGSYMTLSQATADIGAMFEIDTPHNMYIAAFGEVGIFGFFAFVGALFYFGFVVPFRHSGMMALQTAVMAFFMIVGGIGETHEVFGAGFGMFVTMCMFSGMRRSVEDETPKTPSASRDETTLLGNSPQAAIPKLA